MSTKTNLILDLTMLGAFLAVSNPHLTGISIHEWLAVSLAGAVITHLLLHWNWIVKVGKEFFKKLWHQSRLNFAVNTLFFISMTGTIFSGLLISESVLSTFGIHLDVSRFGHYVRCSLCPTFEMGRHQYRSLHREPDRQSVTKACSASSVDYPIHEIRKEQVRAEGAGKLEA